MKFCLDNDHDQRIFVDRGVDNRLDHVEICDVCAAITKTKELPGTVWREVDSDLCHNCRIDIFEQMLSNDIRPGSRPLNRMFEDRIITNDEMEDEPPSMDAILRFLQF